jgi:hypothetical protein
MPLPMRSTSPSSQTFTAIACAGSGAGNSGQPRVGSHGCWSERHLASHVARVPSSHPWTRTPATEAPLVHPDTPQLTPRLVRVVAHSRLEVYAHPEVLSHCMSQDPAWDEHPPAAQHTEIASAVAAIPHGAQHGLCLAPGNTTAIVRCPCGPSEPKRCAQPGAGTSRGAPPQRSIPKSPRLWPPSRTELCMGRALHLGNNRNRALAPLAGAGALRRFRAAGQSEKTHTQHAVRAAVLILRHHHGIGEVSNDERPSSAVPELLSLVFPRGVQGASNRC